MRRRQPEPACRRGGPDSGSHLQTLFLKFSMRFRVEPACRTGRPGMTQISLIENYR